MFDLRLTISSKSAERLKESIWAFIPDLKSSHRAEAVARGLGFRTHAALLAHLDTDGSTTSEVDGLAFKEYLNAREIEAPVTKFYRAMARVAIGDVVEKIPRLTTHGFGIGPVRVSEAASYNEKFTEAQKELFAEGSASEFLLSLALIARISKTATISSKTTSYGLKHTAENYRCAYPTGEPLGPHYVSNGMFITAAVHAGFKFRNRYPSLNATFNMSERSIANIDCEVRPDGARAQERVRRSERKLYM